MGASPGQGFSRSRYRGSVRKTEGGHTDLPGGAEAGAQGEPADAGANGRRVDGSARRSAENRAVPEGSSFRDRSHGVGLLNRP